MLKKGAGEKIKPEVKEQKTTRVAFNVPEEFLDKLRAAAYWERKTLAGILLKAAQEYLSKMEKNRGEPYPPIPQGEGLTPGRPIGMKMKK